MDRKQFIEIEKLRLNSFNLFSSLMIEPDDELLREGAVFRNLESFLAQLLPEKENKLGDLHSQIEKNAFQELQVEYARLFIGPFKVPAPPYSSLHLGEEMVMGNATVWVNNFYQELGLEFDSELRDLPDHAAVETEFLYYLIYNEIKTLDQGFIDDAKAFWQRQKIFTEKHYNVWIPKLCDKVIENTELEYFKIIFQSLKDLVIEVEVPDFPVITG